MSKKLVGNCVNWALSRCDLFKSNKEKIAVQLMDNYVAQPSAIHSKKKNLDGLSP